MCTFWASPHPHTPTSTQPKSHPHWPTIRDTTPPTMHPTTTCLSWHTTTPFTAPPRVWYVRVPRRKVRGFDRGPLLTRTKLCGGNFCSWRATPLWSPTTPLVSIEHVKSNLSDGLFRTSRCIVNILWIFLCNQCKILNGSKSEWSVEQSRSLTLNGHSGTWFTWWHNYTQSEAEGEIERWIQDKVSTNKHYSSDWLMSFSISDFAPASLNPYDSLCVGCSWQIVWARSVPFGSPMQS